MSENLPTAKPKRQPRKTKPLTPADAEKVTATSRIVQQTIGEVESAVKKPSLPTPRFDPLQHDPPTIKGTVTVVNRVFYVDVGSMSPKDVPQYMENVKHNMTPDDQKPGAIEAAKSVGLWEDFFIPVRGVVPGKPNLWQRVKEFFVGRPDRHLSATRIEIHKVEVSL
jgi:Bacteriophage T4-like portal protein (Gp20)